jgi:hypothetical protein
MQQLSLPSELLGEWRALNRARHSAGSIHDDATARSLGFRGGFVGGVTLVSYVVEAWRRAEGLPLALRPFRMTVDLRAPIYEGETARVRGERDDAGLRYAVSGDEETVTMDGRIEPFDRLSWPAPRADGSARVLDGVDLTSLPVQRRGFSRDEAAAYYRDLLATEPEDGDTLPVSVGMWANPMHEIIARLHATHTTVHRSSEMLIAALPRSDRDYRFVTVVEELEARGSGKGVVHVRCDVEDDDGQTLAVVLHRSAVRQRRE